MCAIAMSLRGFDSKAAAPCRPSIFPISRCSNLAAKTRCWTPSSLTSSATLRASFPLICRSLRYAPKGDTSEFVAQGLRRLGYASANLKGGMKAWGEHYATRALVEGPDLAIYQVSRPARGCLSYMVASAGNAIVIDPLRHLHPYDAIHPIDVLPATIPYEFIHDCQVFPFGRHELKALHIPGHTLGLVAFRLDDRYLFTGDSIFIRSIARPDLGGKAETWAPVHGRSLRRLLGLPGEITVLPGHFSSLDEADETGRYAASLDDLKKRNDGLVVLQRESEEGFVRYLLESLPKFIPEYVDIKRVNAGLLAPAEEDAATLELGKNACALSQACVASGGERQ